MDCSHNLSNATHYDVNNASHEFSTVWNETVPGNASGWYFELPNVYGHRLDGQPFSGLAIKRRHGVAISWDGRVIRHGASVMNVGPLSWIKDAAGKKASSRRTMFMESSVPLKRASLILAEKVAC